MIKTKGLQTLQQNTPITTRVITTKIIIVVIHVLLHQFIRFRCKSYLKTDNLLLQKYVVVIGCKISLQKIIM
jgi:hypothetical protein